jgi:hypothetical protein
MAPGGGGGTQINKKAVYYIILYTYILNYYLYIKGELLWCGGEAAVRWGGCGNN